MLLENNGSMLNVIDRSRERGGILHIGEKGSGKTFSQNVWLHDNIKLLETENIFWVRMDATKLVNIWEKSDDLNNPNLITVRDYLLGQTVYVFAKHFLNKFPMCSSFFVEIADILKKSTKNTIPASKISSQYEATLSSSQQELFRYNAGVNKISTIFNYLEELERQISIYENLFKGDNDRLPADERIYTTKSFLVDRVLEESQKIKDVTDKGSKIIWNEIGRILTEIIVDSGFYILYIIDGIDNINFYLSDSKKYKEKLVSSLFEYPLKREHENKNRLLLISLRDTTYEELKIHYRTHYHHDTNVYIDIEYFDKIKQDSENLQKPAFEQRIKFVEKRTSHLKETQMYKIVDAMLKHRKIPNEKRWNSNIRCFMQNHLTLAKLLTYRYYYAGKPSNFNIHDQIDAFENINLLLNGELFIDERLRVPLSNNGDNFFNLFGYCDKDSTPYYLIYTRLLQIVANSPNVSQINIMSITNKFTYNPKNVEECIDRLIRSGYIQAKYIIEYRTLSINITDKGLYALNIFYSDIHYLYNTSIDTLLPKSLVEEFMYARNNFAPKTYGKKYYSPYSVITDILFLQFLIDYHNYEMIRIKNKDPKFNEKPYSLPINNDDLSKSIYPMVNNCYEDEEFKKIVLEHFI
jgi:hypothetical protein